MDQEPKNNNTAADWEGVDEIEQNLQDKIKSDMEQEPKIEQEFTELQKIALELTDNATDLLKFSNWFKDNRDRISKEDIETLKAEIAGLAETRYSLRDIRERTEGPTN